MARPWLLLASLLVACSSAPRGAIELELAPATSCGQAREVIPAPWECIRLQVCPVADGAPADAGMPRDGGARDAGPSGSGCALITVPGGDPTNATDELVVMRLALSSFDAELDPERSYQVVATAYGATGEAVAIGRTAASRPLDGTLRVRLHRFGESSCAGVNEPARDGSLLAAHRALGAAIALPSGDVLFFGGFTGDAVPRQRLTADSRFQPAVDLYDLAASRFRPVSVVDTASPDALPGFRRVLFEARWIGTDESGRDRIRVFGGFTSAGENASPVRFDANVGFSAVSAPVLPGIATSPAPTVDLLFDAASRTLTVAPVMDAAVEASTGGAAVSELVGDAVVRYGGISSTGGENATDPSMVAPTTVPLGYVWTQDTATPTRMAPPAEALARGRYGASLTHLDGTEYLVWGGNLTVPFDGSFPADEHLGFAGLLLTAPRSGEPTVAPVVSDPGGFDALPVAFHSATRVGAGRLLVVGGLAVTSSFVPRMGASDPLTPINLTNPTRPPGLSLIAREGAGFRAVVVGGDAREPTIFHQVTPLATTSGGAPSALLVTGGAATTGGQTLNATAEVGLASGSGDTWSYSSVTALRGARWGHTATLLSNGLVLVAGGYATGASAATLVPTLNAEVLLVDDLLGLPRPAPVTCEDAGTPRPRDTGLASDAGPSDAGPSDAGASDAGASDAGA
jgi:hypothetical protein